MAWVAGTGVNTLGNPIVIYGRQVRSADGVHGLEIKKLKIKKEVPRGGEPVTIDFTVTTEGSFPILCSEYCGNGHTDMTCMLIVRSVSSANP